MSSIVPLVADFYGSDPIRGEDAYLELIRRQGIVAIQTLIPLGEGACGPGSIQAEARLHAVALALGPAIIPYLLQALVEGRWGAKLAAAPCFGAFPGNQSAIGGLVGILEHGQDFDTERLTIEALGYAGAEDHIQDIVLHSKTGSWRPPYDTISSYPFEKLSSYAVEVLARIAARVTDQSHVDSAFRILTDYVHLVQERHPNRSPDAYYLVERHATEFTGRSVDAIIAQWGRGSNERLRLVAMTVLAEVAPLSAARFLLEVATSEVESPGLRSAASIALGEIRHPQAAGLLAQSIRSRAPGAEARYLGWALSTLYSLPVDWSGCEAHLDEVLALGTEESAQIAYAMAVRKEHRIGPSLRERLDHPDPYQRWTAALALARLFGPESRRDLDQRADHAADSVEECALLAAVLRAGDRTVAERLHAALQKVLALPRLRPVWRLEIIESFRTVVGFDPRALRLWRVAAQVTARQLQHFEALLPREDSHATVSVAVPVGAAPRVFVSYSHEDADWLRRFQIMLKPLVAADRLELWDDTRIETGRWAEQIDGAIAHARIALFLVSANLLASDFVTRHELPTVLRHAESGDLRVVWVLLDDCLWEESPLADFQGENASQPLTLLNAGEQSRMIKKACQKVRDLLDPHALVLGGGRGQVM